MILQNSLMNPIYRLMNTVASIAPSHCSSSCFRALLLAFVLASTGGQGQGATPRADTQAKPGAADPAPVAWERLWSGVVPGGRHTQEPERDTTKAGDNRIADREVIRLGNVSDPAFSVYRPTSGKKTDVTVLVCPGGGYHILAMDLEGTEVCQWLNSIGVTAILLKYRVPKRATGPGHEMAVQDGQRAMSLLRHRSAELGLNPNRIGVLGFSAGAHLAAMLSAGPEQRSYPRVDDADTASFRPNFSILIYPGYLTRKEQPDHAAPEFTCLSNSPPSFITMAQDDPIGVQIALGYAMALNRLKVPLSLHIYPEGGHGYGLRPAGKAATSWPDRVEEWMRGLR